LAKNTALSISCHCGITFERLPEVLKAGVEGVALISAITKADDPLATTQQMLESVESVVSRKIGFKTGTDPISRYFDLLEHSMRHQIITSFIDLDDFVMHFMKIKSW